MASIFSIPEGSPLRPSLRLVLITLLLAYFVYVWERRQRQYQVSAHNHKRAPT
jgi:hypothetical protein